MSLSGEAAARTMPHQQHGRLAGVRLDKKAYHNVTARGSVRSRDAGHGSAPASETTATLQQQHTPRAANLFLDSRRS
jgi:hypothetical protein